MTQKTPLEKAEAVMLQLLNERGSEGKPDTYHAGATDLLHALEAAGLLQSPGWEYGHMPKDIAGRNLPISETTRTPKNWLHSMAQPYRRRAAVAIPAGEWEESTEEITIEHDGLPWLRPGAHMDNHPRENRTAHDEGDGWEFKPRRFYEQDIEKYGFERAACGRTDFHWPHSNRSIAYCSGLNESKEVTR